MKSFRLFLATCLLFAAPFAFAIDLDTAKQQGLVGETTGGYLAAVEASPSSEVIELVESINTQRKIKYREIAARNDTTLTAVEKLAGKKAIEKSAPGSYVRIDGSWRQK